jgi:hypothetical protein
VISLPLLASLACRWLVAAVAAAGNGQNILPMYEFELFGKKLNIDNSNNYSILGNSISINNSNHNSHLIEKSSITIYK